MPTLQAYPLFTVKHLKESRDFFQRCFYMLVAFEASWVVMLSNQDGGPISLGLMSHDHPSNPPGPEMFDGRGMIMTFQVDDASTAHARLKELGAPIVYDLKDEPWGQRRFMVRDPSSILVDVVEQREPAPGYWEKFMGS